MQSDMLPSYTWAESVAYSSFIRSRLGPLVDISLYVSDDNYANATRPEFSKRGMLPWPAQYYVPGDRRAQVWDRAVQVLVKYGLDPHEIDLRPILDLGLESNTASTGVDTTWTAAPSGTAESHTRSRGLSSIFGPKQSTSTLGIVSKLQTLISKSLRPVAAPLFAVDSDPTLGIYFFKRQNPTSIDCLILGYLCLAIYPPLPNRFLVDGIQELDRGVVGTRILAWADEFRGRVFGPPIDGHKILNPGTAEGSTNNNNYNPTTSSLPWKIERANLPGLTGYITSATQTYLESWVPMWAKKKSNREERVEENERNQRSIFTRGKLETIATVVVGTCAFLAFILSRTTVSLVAIEYTEEEVGEGKEKELEIVDGEEGVEKGEEGEEGEEGEKREKGDEREEGGKEDSG